MKAIIFGASKNAGKLYQQIFEKYEVVAFADNDRTKWAEKIYNLPIVAPERIIEMDYDEILVASMAIYAIQKQLMELGIEKSKINISYMELKIKAREQFLYDYSKIVYDNHIEGSVAEAGVFQGEFAKVINERFPDKKCYLFDTFEGFDERDIQIEKKNNFSDESIGHLNFTSEESVLAKMKYVGNCIIKKGYFPETVKGIEDTFCFVNLDMDLYKPTLEGLKFFWDKMQKGGVILVHDYFGEAYKGVKSAVQQFLIDKDVPLIPIGDSLSIAIIKM